MLVRLVMLIAAPAAAALGLLALPADVEPEPQVVNGSCGGDLRLDITYPVQVEEPATVYVQITDSEGNTYSIELIDQDGDAQGFHPMIPADQLPDGGYDVVLSVVGNDVYIAIYDQGEVCGGSGLPTVTPSPLPTVSPEPSVSPGATPSGTQSPTPGPITTPSGTQSPTPTSSAEPSTLPGRIPRNTPSPDPSGSALPDATVSTGPKQDADADSAEAATAVAADPRYTG